VATVIETAVRDAAAEAADFLDQMEGETGRPARGRAAVVERELLRTGTYWQTFEEIEFGSRVAWRNNARCIGRNHWRSLELLDRRELDDPRSIFDACVDHIQMSTRGGRIKPLISVFAPLRPGEPYWRIWNPQLIRYAGWR